MLHVHRRLVAPPALAVPFRVRLVDCRHRLPCGHPIADPWADLLHGQLPLPERSQPTQVVDELVGVNRAGVPGDELWDEVRLVGDRQLRIPVQHHPEKRRAGAANAEEQERRLARGRHTVDRTRGGLASYRRTTTIALSLWPRSETTSRYRPGAPAASTRRRLETRPWREPIRHAYRCASVDTRTTIRPFARTGIAWRASSM